MKVLFFFGLLCFAQFSFAQSSAFQSAYNAQPSIPKGLLEAIAWSNTRMVHLNNPMESCSGMPAAYGILGLFDDGKDYFLENGKLVAELSGISVQAQKASAEQQLIAYATAYESVRNSLNAPAQDPQTIREVLHTLSEIPDSGYVNFLAREMQVYQILTFMRSSEQANVYGFNAYHFNLEDIFGEENYAVLSAPKILFTPNGIRNQSNELFEVTPEKSLQYGPAIWNPAPSCNFSSRNGVAVSAITIHTIQGSYAGAISWSQNCTSNVSFHYVIRSSDGQVTQMVLEQDKGWHVGSENPYTIGYEHEGYVDNPVWYTEAMYNSSADLSIDIINSGYGISPLRTFFGDATIGTNTLGGCTKIKGHQHYPNQTHTDPGINWDWEKYYKLINNTYTPTLVQSQSGTLMDSGGAGNYSDDERSFWLIQPSNATDITINFTTFSIELNYDYLFLYDGADVDAPLIGKYTGTNSPGIVTSSGGSMLIEFRSDCSTVDQGWVANYTSTLNDNQPPVTAINPGSLWKTNDFTVTFTDSDLQGSISERFYVIAENELSPNDWYGKNGFVYEDFSLNDIRWTNVTGNYTVNTNKYHFTDEAEQNSSVFIEAEQSSAYSYLYTWKQEFISNGTNKRAGMHFFCDDPLLTNRGNSYFVFLREDDDAVHLYKVVNDVFSLVQNVPVTLNQGIEYDVTTYFDPTTGTIRVFINGSLLIQWQDVSPHTGGTALSFRTGGCAASFDELRMYRSRGTSVNVSAGFGDEMEIESTGAIPTGRITALSIDDAMNISPFATQDYLLDFTEPEIDWLNDGAANDIDSFYTSTLEANWQGFDVHSGIGSYSYAIGTPPNLDNVIPWTNVSFNESISEILLNPIYDEVYRVSLELVNGAGLSQLYISDGQRYLQGLSLSEEALGKIVLYPNPASNEIQFDGLTNAVAFHIYDIGGREVLEGNTDGSISIVNLASGTYKLVLRSADSFVVKEFIRQ
jgi:N-acetyl-anhydromuramyl-L-alanine amidase AmpD